MNKRILSLALALCFVCSLLPITTFAEEEVTSGTCGDNLTWQFASSTLYIQGTGKMDGFALSNPPWEHLKDEIQAIKIFEGVTSIGGCAFGQLDNLVNVDLPSSLLEINRSAFYGCDQLAEISFPSGLNSIGADAFNYCTNLTALSIPSTILSLGNYAFANCANLTTVNFEGNAPTIAAYAFDYVTITAYFPANDSTWTNEVMSDYGGTISWNPYCHNICDFVTVDPTCTENGYTAYVCMECGSHYLEKAIPATGHNFGNCYVTPPTCTNYGYTTYSCIFCGDSYIDDKVPATGHSFGEWIKVKEATTTETGMEERTCSKCGETESRIIPKVSISFSDVKSTDWFATFVYEAVDRGLMVGMGNNKFSPNGTTSRAMIVQILYNMNGKPVATGSNPFTDVPRGSWYYDAVQWAYENKITKGVSDTFFAPNAPVTREQMAMFLYSYMGRPEVYGDLSGFADPDKVSGWAKDAVVWATQNNIITGSLDGGKLYLNPRDSATRAQTATVMVRFDKLMEN